MLAQVQQVLASPNVLERLLKDEDTIKSIRKIFTGLYSLDLVSSNFFILLVGTGI